MKAVVRDRYGSADVLQLRDVDVPEVGVDDVLVRVHAAGIDRGAWHIMAGLPYLIRLVGYGVRRPKAAGLGSEVAGVVEGVGAQVTGLRPGDSVYGTARASFAEYSLARPDRLARMPAACTRTSTSSTPTSGTSTSLSCRTSAEPYRSRTMAFIVRPRVAEAVAVVSAPDTVCCCGLFIC